MSSAHLLYIPLVTLLGLVIGYIAGARAVRADVARKKRRMKE